MDEYCETCMNKIFLNGHLLLPQRFNVSLEKERITLQLPLRRVTRRNGSTKLVSCNVHPNNFLLNNTQERF